MHCTWIGAILYATPVLTLSRDNGLRYHPVSQHARRATHGQVLNKTNWAGPFIYPPPSNEKFNFASGQFILPLPSSLGVPAGAADGTYYVSQWVGLDGVGGDGIILQSGVDTSITKSGNNSSIDYAVWWEWFPNDSVYLADDPTNTFTVWGGDTISVTINYTDPHTGFVFLENVSSGKQFEANQTVTDASGLALQGASAEWITEDLSQGTLPSILADFGAVRFEKCRAGTTGGTMLDLDNASVYDLEPQMTVEATATVLDQESFEVTYIGS